MTLLHTNAHSIVYARHSNTEHCWVQLASKRRCTCSTPRPIWNASGVNIDSFKVAAATTDSVVVPVVRPTIYYMRI